MNWFKSLLNNYRAVNAFVFLMNAIAMLFALLFLQKHLGLAPCPLCIFQRIGVMVMGGFAFIAMLLNLQSLGARLFLWGAGLAGMAWSAGVAAWHVYIQHLPPDQVPACGPGLNYWIETLPWQQVLKEVFAGSGECAAIDWTFLGLSIPEQSLILFVFLLGVQFWLLCVIWQQRTPKKPKSQLKS